MEKSNNSGFGSLPQASVDLTNPDSSSPSPRLRSSPSSHRFFSKNACAICLEEMRKGEGQAIFTAECSHSFHFQCIVFNVKHGNRICPLCRSYWKHVPLGHDSTTSAPIPRRRSETSFADDESLPHEETQFESNRSDSVPPHPALHINLFPQISELPNSVARDDFPVLVHLKAEGVSERRNRASLDLIAVLDVSGSMSGVKMELMKQAMLFVIQNLGETDRLSVISFSSTAHRLFPLRLMTETGKQVATRAVNLLVARGGTDIAEGLRIGAKVIEHRRWRNPVSGVILLSDGLDNNIPSVGYSRPEYESLLPTSFEVPIHTFGFGSDHDSNLLHTISEISSGTFSFIETETAIQDAFAQCIGGLLSVVVLEQIAKIECFHQGIKISTIKAGRYRAEIDESNAQSATIYVGDMYAEEERDFVVILEVPCSNTSAESMSLLKVRCLYKDPVTKEIIHVESEEVCIQRPVEPSGQEVVSIEVDRQLSRFLVAEAMEESRVLADGGDLNSAVQLLRNRERLLSETVSAQSSDRLCQSLSAELIALQERMANRRMYQTSGRAYALSSMSSHSTQRATSRGDSTQLYSPVQAYQTSGMAQMVSRSQQLRIGRLDIKPSLPPFSSPPDQS